MDRELWHTCIISATIYKSNGRFNNYDKSHQEQIIDFAKELYKEALKTYNSGEVKF